MRATVFVVFLVLVSFVPPATAGIISWNVTYADGNSAVGFGLGNAVGQTRRNTFEAALNYVSATFDTADVTLDFAVNASETDGGGFLASAGTSFFVTPGFSNGILYQHATTGIDPTGGSDGFVTFDFGYNWNPENDTPTGGQFDLFTVALHEVTHALGFLSLTGADGTSRLNSVDPGPHSVLDSFLVNVREIHSSLLAEILLATRQI